MVHLFRNARVGSLNGVTQEAGQLIRLHMRSEVMPAVCEEMKWEVVSNGELLKGAKAVTLEGEIPLTFASFAPNGLSQFNVKIEAIAARDFKLKTKGKKKGDSNSKAECELLFTLVFKATKSNAKELMHYWLNVGDGDAVMNLHAVGVTAPLFEDAPASQEDAEDAGEEDIGGSVASSAEMGEVKKRGRGRPRKDAAVH